VASNTLTLSGHGLTLNTEVTLRADAGGSLPSPLASGTVYYAIPVTDAVFQLSATEGGAAIDLTTAGSNVMLSRDLPVDDWIAAATALVDESLPAHAPPITGTVPTVIKDYTARLAAQRGLIYVGGETLDIERLILQSQKLVDQWAKGQPVRGVNAPTSTNVAIRSSISSVDSRGWVRNGQNGRIP